MRFRGLTYAFTAITISSVLVSGTSLSSERDLTGKEQRAFVCSSVVNAADRLECYDLFYRKAKSDQSQSYIGKWRINAGKSTKDQTSRVVMRVNGQLQSSAKKKSKTKIHFYAACRSDVTNFWFNFGEQLGGQGSKMSLNYRTDNQQPKTLELTKSNNKKSVGEWGDEQSKKFLTALLEASSLNIEYVQEDKTKVKIGFDIKGLNNAIKPLAEACSWPSA